jgi:hypothetical protein
MLKTHKHSEYVIVIASPQQQRLHECASLLHLDVTLPVLRKLLILLVTCSYLYQQCPPFVQTAVYGLQLSVASTPINVMQQVLIT